MKKLVLIGFVLISVNSFSQGFKQGVFSRLHFGLKAGANYSNFTNTNFSTDALIGYHAGGLVNFRITDNFSIQEEFLFSSQGAKVNKDVFGKDNIKLYYISVPFLLKYRTNAGIYIEAGPQVGMRANEDIDGLPVKEFAKKLDMGVAGGLGFQLKNGLGIGARYVAGISKVGDFDMSNVKSDFRNSVVQASVFYIF